MIKVVLFSFAFILSACSGDNGANEIRYIDGVAVETSKDVTIPKALFEKIENEFIAHFKEFSPDAESKDDKLILAQIKREYFDIEVLMHEKNKGTLIHNTKFVVPRGGGTIDLADYVVGKVGSFYLKWKLLRNAKPFEEVNQVKVYYVSDAKKRKLDDEEYGNGCGKYMEIGTFFHKLRKDFFRVNATQQRYVSVLAGTYLFTKFEGPALIMGSLTIQDRRYPQLTCQRPNVEVN
jgi:hypothetical protein